MGLAANWQISMSYASISIATGRFGGRCLKTGAGHRLLADLPDPVGSDRGFSFGWRPDLRFLGIAVCLAARSDRRLPVLPAHRQPRQSDRLPRIGRQCPDRSWPEGAPVLHANTWHYIEVEGVIGDTGAVRIYVDGAKVLDLAGVDTQQQANAQIGIIQLGYGNSSATYLFDDLYVTDTDRAWASARSPCSPPPPMWPRPSPRRPAPTTTPASTMPCPTPPIT
jgi:hypothetical protein